MAEQDAWEGGLRRSLSEQAAGAPPASADLATHVLSRARRAHRRRTGVRLVAVVAATALATGGFLHGWQAAPPRGGGFGAVTGIIGDPVPHGSPSAPARLATDEDLAGLISADLLGPGVDGGTVLAATDGTTVDLGSRVRQVHAATRVGSGVAIISGEPGSMRLWWVAPGQPPRSVLTGVDAIAVQHSRVAWQRGGMLAVATLDGSRLADRVTTVGADRAGQPAGLIGDTVLLRRTGPGGRAAWDTWDPERGDYRAGWVSEVIRVFGPLPEGAGALGLVTGAGERLCLARLAVPELAPRQTQCLDPELVPAAEGAPAAVSPDHRWLLLGTDGAPLLIEVGALFENPVAEAVTPLAGVAPITAAVWPATDRVVLTAGERLVQVEPERWLVGGPGAKAETGFEGDPPVIVGSG